VTHAQEDVMSCSGVRVVERRASAVGRWAGAVAVAVLTSAAAPAGAALNAQFDDFNGLHHANDEIVGPIAAVPEPELLVLLGVGAVAFVGHRVFRLRATRRVP